MIPRDDDDDERAPRATGKVSKAGHSLRKSVDGDNPSPQERDAAYVQSQVPIKQRKVG